LNALDVKLHQRALELLQQRRDQQTTAGSLQALPKVTAVNSTTSKGKGKHQAVNLPTASSSIMCGVSSMDASSWFNDSLRVSGTFMMKPTVASWLMLSRFGKR
jgi:hypothetical protein